MLGRNFTLPFGFGVKRNFGKKLDVGLEWKTRWTRSDALDGFSSLFGEIDLQIFITHRSSSIFENRWSGR